MNVIFLINMSHDSNPALKSPHRVCHFVDHSLRAQNFFILNRFIVFVRRNVGKHWRYNFVSSYHTHILHIFFCSVYMGTARKFMTTSNVVISYLYARPASRASHPSRFARNSSHMLYMHAFYYDKNYYSCYSCQV